MRGNRTEVIAAGLAPHEQEEPRVFYARVGAETDSAKSVKRLPGRLPLRKGRGARYAGRAMDFHGPVFVRDVYNDPLMNGLLEVYRERRVDTIGDVGRRTAFVIKTYFQQFLNYHVHLVELTKRTSEDQWDTVLNGHNIG